MGDAPRANQTSDTLRLLRRMDEKLDLILAEFSAMKPRQTQQFGRLRKDVLGLNADTKLRLDRIETRLDRIERRLDLADAPPV